MCALSAAALVLQPGICAAAQVFVTETIWPTEPKIFAASPLESLQPLTWSYQVDIRDLSPGLTVIFSVYITWHVLKCLLWVKPKELGRRADVVPASRALSRVGS